MSIFSNGWNGLLLLIFISLVLIVTTIVLALAGLMSLYDRRKKKTHVKNKSQKKESPGKTIAKLILFSILVTILLAVLAIIFADVLRWLDPA